MRFVYSDHARANMTERRISNHVVEDVVVNPEQITDSRRGRKIAQKTVGNRLLRVVYKEAEKVYIIVTVYFARIGRY